MGDYGRDACIRNVSCSNGIVLIHVILYTVIKNYPVLVYILVLYVLIALRGIEGRIFSNRPDRICVHAHHLVINSVKRDAVGKILTPFRAVVADYFYTAVNGSISIAVVKDYPISCRSVANISARTVSKACRNTLALINNEVAMVEVVEAYRGYVLMYVYTVNVFIIVERKDSKLGYGVFIRTV